MLSLRLPAHDRPIKLVAESLLEKDAALVCAARPDVHDLIDQPGAVSFVRANGKAGVHHFDFLFIDKAGARSAIAVKPWIRASRPEFQDEMVRVRAATPLSFAQRVLLITERHFDRTDAWNAARLQDALRQPDPALDDRIERWLVAHGEPIRFRELTAKSGLGARAWPATVRLLHAGRIRRLDGGRIGMDTRLAAEARP